MESFNQSSAGQITDVRLHEATRSRYLNYALSVITSRALPDVRDGLKPVQRRILYAMLHNLHLRPDGRYRKSAAVVGEVMAKYHPHGDSAIYDAMVRMAQVFSLRYPLVDGQGNFGSLDGDKAAAMRYTESKLQPLAIELLTELKRDTVPMRTNYDGTLQEPVVLPAQFPNLLVNGVTGIAVGMATNIPPHHLGEVINGLVELIDSPEATTADLCKHIQGPDFPTGGMILNSAEELQSIYENGSGAVRMRGHYRIETVGRSKQIIIESIPYNVLKSDLVSQIADLVIKNRLPQVTDVRDESTEEVRVVCELKRGANAEAAMAYIFKHTALQTAFHVNMTVLCPTDNPEVCAPSKLGLKPVLRHFLDFRLVVTIRRLEHMLRELLERIHILEGFEKVFDALDEAIAIIRSSDDKADAAKRLIARFDLSDIQADAVLETRLHKLARMEMLAIRIELAEKRGEAARLQKLLGNKGELWALIRRELLELRDKYHQPRRTEVNGPVEEKNYEAEVYIVDEPAYLIVTRGGWIKRQKSFKDIAAIRVRESDEVGWLFETSTRRTVTFFTHIGAAYTLRVDSVPSTTGYGEPVQRHFQFADGERIVGVIVHDGRTLPHLPAPEPEASELPAPDAVTLEEKSTPEQLAAKKLLEGPWALAVTKGGKCLRLPLKLLEEVSTKNGRKFARLDSKRKDDNVLAVHASGGQEYLCLVSEKSQALVFRASDVKVLKGPGQGVTAMKLISNDALSHYVLAADEHSGIQYVTSRGREDIISARKSKVKARGAKGIPVITRGTITVNPTGPELHLNRQDN